jgi:hypothetical protein
MGTAGHLDVDIGVSRSTMSSSSIEMDHHVLCERRSAGTATTISTLRPTRSRPTVARQACGRNRPPIGARAAVDPDNVDLGVGKSDPFGRGPRPRPR